MVEYPEFFVRFIYFNSCNFHSSLQRLLYQSFLKGVKAAI